MGTTDAPTSTTTRPSGLDDVAREPLLDVLARRRSRRFALGDNLQGGAFSYPFADQWRRAADLLLNGNPSWSFGWRDVVLRLRERFRCIVPDYPGFGLSREAPGFDFRPSSQSRVVEALVDRLGSIA